MQFSIPCAERKESFLKEPTFTWSSIIIVETINSIFLYKQRWKLHLTMWETFLGDGNVYVTWWGSRCSQLSHLVKY
jgi:hypothetical protein